MNGTPLKDIIRFIVIAKGVPFKIHARTDAGGISESRNVVVDRLLCLVGETIDDPDALLDYFWADSCLYNPPNDYILNPYYNVDPNFSMEQNFLPNHFSKTINLFGQPRDITLSYLVSRLDAPFLDTVKSMIDRSIAAINSTNYDWFIDADPVPCRGGGFLKQTNTKNIFDALGITNYFIDNYETVYTNHNKPIMSYSSNGIWTTNGPYSWPNCQNFAFDSNYIQTQLSFAYAPGAIFNTAESFNGHTIGSWPIIRLNGQGQIPEFILTGGTVGVCQAYHGTEGGGGRVIDNSIMLPSYAMGYTFIEAAYMGMSHLTDERVFIGDPLTRITYPCEPWILSGNTTIYSGDYDCDIIVPEGVTLTVNSSLYNPVNFRRNASIQVEGILQVENNAALNFYGYSELFISGSGIINFGSGTHMIFNGRTRCIIENDFEINSTFNFVFNDESEFHVNDLVMNTNSSIIFNNKSKLSIYNTFNLNPGTTLNFNNDSKLKLIGSLISTGESSNKVTINLSSTPLELQFQITDAMILEIDNTIFNNNGIVYSLSSGFEPENFLITNSIFNNPVNGYAIQLNPGAASFQTIPLISNCTFNNCSIGAIYFGKTHSINIENNSISLGLNAVGIYMSNSGVVNIFDCIINGGARGISTPLPHPDEDIQENLSCDLNIEQCVFDSQNSAIELNAQLMPFSSIYINGNHFEDCKEGITINAFSNSAYDFIPFITNNVITGNIFLLDLGIGVTLSNGAEALVSNNSITNFRVGISLTNVNAPYIIENFISAIDLDSNFRRSGILVVSSNGEIRENTIQHHNWGIELGSSSPKIGANTITNNKAYGIYISDNSNPDLTGSFVGEDQFPLSGYNTIRENGLCTETRNSELYLLSSLVKLEKGCNTIADDRDGVLQQCNNLYLVDGRKIPESIIQAKANYWGNHPVYGNDPTGRFGEEVTIDYSDFLPEPCTYSQGEAELILANSKGEVYDTVYSTGNMASGLSDIESRYATANSYYYNNQYDQANQEYEGIIQSYGNNNESIQAYNRLYTIASLTNSSPSVFNQLKDFYLQQAANQTDSLMIGTLKHLSDLCLVSAEEYLPAINNFDEIAQQNPNTDIALYRQIDALTTSLLVPQDSTVNKGVLGKYGVTNLSDYTQKLNELLKNRGKSGLKSNEELIPKEFTLYQNYPNPFNPVTTIKYYLPNTSDVLLIIYDILGRKVKELVNTKQQAGRYEVQFDASNLASGVYIYQLMAEKFISSKKMLLLK